MYKSYKQALKKLLLVLKQVKKNKFICVPILQRIQMSSNEASECNIILTKLLNSVDDYS